METNTKNDKSMEGNGNVAVRPRQLAVRVMPRRRHVSSNIHNSLGPK